jgi:hypothetical protein
MRNKLHDAWYVKENCVYKSTSKPQTWALTAPRTLALFLALLVGSAALATVGVASAKSPKLVDTHIHYSYDACVG